LENLVVEQKFYVGNTQWDFENDFENLGMDCYSIDGFQN
jgi:hypothetical protein